MYIGSESMYGKKIPLQLLSCIFPREMYLQIVWVHSRKEEENEEERKKEEKSQVA